MSELATVRQFARIVARGVVGILVTIFAIVCLAACIVMLAVLGVVLTSPHFVAPPAHRRCPSVVAHIKVLRCTRQFRPTGRQAFVAPTASFRLCAHAPYPPFRSRQPPRCMTGDTSTPSSRARCAASASRTTLLMG